MSYKCIIHPSGKEIITRENENLLSALKREGFQIKSSCGGCASCGDCVIKVTANHENLQDMSFDEKKILGNVFHLTKERLACQTKLRGNVEIDISDHPQKQLVRENTSILLRKKVALDSFEPKREKKIFKIGGRKRPKKFNFSDEE